MELFLVRHGNTFNKGDKIVWVGRNEDLPLTESGEKQAFDAASYLKDKGITKVYCAPLQRTRRFAEIITTELNLPDATVDERLIEVDYGSWGGKSNEEVAAFSAESAKQQDAWVNDGVWPPAGVWGSTRDEIKDAIMSFAKDIRTTHHKNDNIVIVSSNGCLRFFLELLQSVPEEISESHGKVKTGHVCSLSDSGEEYTVNYWNLKPEN